MLQRVIPKTSFETRLPDGWFLSRLYKGKRVLYYKDIRVDSLTDGFDIEDRVRQIILNPPDYMQFYLYRDGKIGLGNLTPKTQKKLVTSGMVSYEVALNCFKDIRDWLCHYVPRTAEYAGEIYTTKYNRWYNSDGECINNSNRFLSIWDARVRYAKGEVTLEDVAMYSWAGVLECLGDDHQRYVNNYLKPKLEVNRKGWVWDAKYKKKKKLEKNEMYKHTEFDESEEIEDEYREDVNSCLHNYFFSSLDNHVQMFTDDCNVPAFKNIKQQTVDYENEVVLRFNKIERKLQSFRWDTLLKAYQPVFAPKAMTDDRREDFFDLVHQVIVGKMSGHEAALHFNHGDWKKIKREQNRYSKSLTQNVPFYTDSWKKLDPKNSTFKEAVSYVRKSIRDLITLGFRPSHKVITSFNYDNLRFAMDVRTGEVHYIGFSEGKYMPDSWLGLKPEQRRAKLNDDEEWEYQEKAIKRYNKLFSYLYNVVHKHWDRMTYYIQDKAIARHKYLRPSTKFLAKMRERAEMYLNTLERGAVVC